jgi:2-methylaconitate cis-trans-isomerase PrpF
MTDVRVAAAVRMGICKEPAEARETVLNLPDVIVVAGPPGDAAGITARFVSCDRPHRAAPVTSSMALAAAVRISGTIPSTVARCTDSNVITIYHPSGTIDVMVEMNGDEHVSMTSILRTARRIMQGQVLVPSDT